MAARLRANHQDDVRNKIRGSQLVNFLQNHALSGRGGKNSATRIRAACALLSKVLPDLATTQTQQLGKDGKPVDPAEAQPIIHMTVGVLPEPKKGNGHG